MINNNIYRKLFFRASIFSQRRLGYQLYLLVVILVFAFFQSILYSQPVANNDVLNIFTNSGANTVDVQANDVYGPPMTTTIFTAPLNGVALVLSNDSIVYTPDTNFCGIDSLIYKVTDSGNPLLFDKIGRASCRERV